MKTEYARQDLAVDIEEKLATMRDIEQSEFWLHVVDRLLPQQRSVLKAELRRYEAGLDRA